MQLAKQSSLWGVLWLIILHDCVLLNKLSWDQSLQIIYYILISNHKSILSKLKLISNISTDTSLEPMSLQEFSTLTRTFSYVNNFITVVERIWSYKKTVPLLIKSVILVTFVEKLDLYQSKCKFKGFIGLFVALYVKMAILGKTQRQKSNFLL